MFWQKDDQTNLQKRLHYGRHILQSFPESLLIKSAYRCIQWLLDTYPECLLAVTPLLPEAC